MNDDVILVDNTNTMKWEYENYVLLAELEGYKVEVITVPFDPEMAEVYHERNTHGVPLGLSRIRWHDLSIDGNSDY